MSKQQKVNVFTTKPKKGKSKAKKRKNKHESKKEYVGQGKSR